MVVARRLLMGGGGSFTTPDLPLYCLFNGQNGDGVYAIGAASKAVGGTWAEYGSNPVFQKAGAGWEASHIKDPWLLHDGTQYVMYYAGYSGSAYQVGRATASAYTGPWTRYASNPVVALGAGGTFDDAGVLFPTVLHEPFDAKPWKMWYGADSGTVQTIGYAYSTNGTSWTKVGQVLTVGAGGQWDDIGILPMAIYKNGTTYNLFYGGRQSATAPVFWQGGIATFTDPEGAYTKSGSNPVLLARFNDAGVFQTPSANTAAGSAIVTMPATAAFNVGEPVVLADGDSETETWEVLTKDSATQITLNATAVSSFTTAQGFAFRPFAGVSVLPRTVRVAYAGGYEMFGTPFQAVDDLTVGGTQLREGAMRWTASALTGPWAYDYTTGLLFSLYPTNTGWDKFSAENPSVIPAP